VSRTPDTKYSHRAQAEHCLLIIPWYCPVHGFLVSQYYTTTL